MTFSACPMTFANTWSLFVCVFSNSQSVPLSERPWRGHQTLWLHMLHNNKKLFAQSWNARPSLLVHNNCKLYTRQSNFICANKSGFTSPLDLWDNDVTSHSHVHRRYSVNLPPCTFSTLALHSGTDPLPLHQACQRALTPIYASGCQNLPEVDLRSCKQILNL